MKGLIVSPLGGLIGLLMGAVGGGGSLIAIPILIYLADQSTREAQSGALIIVLVASVAGLGAHLRGGDVRWRAGITFGLATGATALGASVLSRSLDENVLLLAFAPVMALGGAAMLSDKTEDASSFEPWRGGVAVSEVARVIALGLAVGGVIGLFGVGGGFVIVPVLVIVLGLSMVEAVGTSLLIVTIGSLFALGERLGAGDVDWGVAVPFAVAALLGALAGRAVADRLPSRVLRRAFAAVVIATAIYVGADALIALL